MYFRVTVFGFTCKRRVRRDHPTAACDELEVGSEIEARHRTLVRVIYFDQFYF